jgi:DNA-binding transcriptional ArsR family regulator
MINSINSQDVFYALGEPNRRRIVELLAKEGELSASDIYGRFKVSAPAVSQHLKVLREANVVKVEKRAQQRVYQINTGAIDELDAWVKHMKELWNDRFDRLDEVLKTLKINPPKKRK